MVLTHPCFSLSLSLPPPLTSFPPLSNQQEMSLFLTSTQQSANIAIPELLGTEAIPSSLSIIVKLCVPLQELQKSRQYLPTSKEEGKRPRAFPKAITRELYGTLSCMSHRPEISHVTSSGKGGWEMWLYSRQQCVLLSVGVLLLENRRMATWGQEQSLPQEPVMCCLWNPEVTVY